MKIARKIAPLLVLIGGAASLHADNPQLGGSGGELGARATQIELGMKSDYKEVVNLQSQARKLKDVIKLNCVNDKLVQIKATMNIADSAREQLQVEISVGNKANRQVWYDQLSANATTVRELRQEAGACLGEIELSKEEGSTYSHPDFLDDPSVIPFDVYTEAPAYASPFN